MKLGMDSTAIAQPQTGLHEPLYPSLTLSEIQQNYQVLHHKLRIPEVAYNIYHTFYDTLKLLPDIEITNCICLGLGTLTGVEGQRLSALEIIGRENSLHQLVVLTMLLDTDLLGARHAVRDLWIQDPEFSETDHVFLESLGFIVLKHPKALEKITSNTFVFAPCVSYYLTVEVLTACHPALYMGNRLDHLVKQLSVTVAKHSLDPLPLMVLETLTRFRDASRLVPFPVLEEDSPLSWTRITGIHWLRKEGEGGTLGEYCEQEERMIHQES